MRELGFEVLIWWGQSSSSSSSASGSVSSNSSSDALCTALGSLSSYHSNIYIQMKHRVNIHGKAVLMRLIVSFYGYKVRIYKILISIRINLSFIIATTKTGST